MSPNRRISEATTRPYSSRKIRSTCGVDESRVGHPDWKGRTSTRPSHAADASIASFSAASRSGASRIQNPPIHSFASANGPSVMIGSCPVASTVVVVLDRLEAAAEHPDAGVGDLLVEGVDLA